MPAERIGHAVLRVAARGHTTTRIRLSPADFDEVSAGGDVVTIDGARSVSLFTPFGSIVTVEDDEQEDGHGVLEAIRRSKTYTEPL